MAGLKFLPELFSPVETSEIHDLKAGWPASGKRRLSKGAVEHS
jgi:hypothetical protein